jgi:hypothetical protein
MHYVVRQNVVSLLSIPDSYLLKTVLAQLFLYLVKVETVCSSESLVRIYQITRYHILKESNLQL